MSVEPKIQLISGGFCLVYVVFRSGSWRRQTDKKKLFQNVYIGKDFPFIPNQFLKLCLVNPSLLFTYVARSTDHYFLFD